MYAGVFVQVCEHVLYRPGNRSQSKAYMVSYTRVGLSAQVMLQHNKGHRLSHEPNTRTKHTQWLICTRNRKWIIQLDRYAYSAHIHKRVGFKDVEDLEEGVETDLTNRWLHSVVACIPASWGCTLCLGAGMQSATGIATKSGCRESKCNHNHTGTQSAITCGCKRIQSATTCGCNHLWLQSLSRGGNTDRRLHVCEINGCVA